MKLEQQVVSLELAKELKEAGYPQESLYRWRKYSLAEKPALYQIPEGTELGVLSGKLEFEYSAPTVAELGEALLKESLSISFSHKKWCAEIHLKDDDETSCYTSDETMAGVLGKMWIELKKEGLIFTELESLMFGGAG